MPSDRVTIVSDAHSHLAAKGPALIDTYVRDRVLPALKTCGLTTAEIIGQTSVQEVVYLLGRTGCDLGYRFKWEPFGPYSRELAEDLEDLDAATVESAPVSEDFGTDALTEFFKTPDELELDPSEWLRLLISVDFVERSTPGATENGHTPPFIALNYDSAAIRVARSCAEDRLTR